MDALVTPVIMSGGAGTRLWPASRAASPKQLHVLAGERTLLQDTLDRVAPADDGLFGPAVVVCNLRYADQVRTQLSDLADRPHLILEPFGRNTAAVAACVAAWMVDAGRGSDLVLLAPADHRMASAAPFRAAVRAAIPAAQDGRLVTLGVQPTRPETGYGYIRMGAPLGEVFEAAAFVEKPDLETARAYVAGGDYVWNAGYFLFRADRMLEEMQRFRPDIADAAREAVQRGSAAGEDALLLDAEAFAACPSDSIDYAVMEKADRIAVARMDAGWSDLGSWEAVWEAGAPDASGNVTSGDVLLQEATGCLVRTDGLIVTVRGVDDLVIVVSDGAVLVLPRERSQEVKQLVEALKAGDRTELL